MTIVLTWHAFLNAGVEVVTMPVKCYLWTNQNATLRPRLLKQQSGWWVSQFAISELQVMCVCDSWNIFNYVRLFYREFEHHLMVLISLLFSYLFLSLTFNRTICWISLFFLKLCFSYELLFFCNYLALPKTFLIWSFSHEYVSL